MLMVGGIRFGVNYDVELEGKIMDWCFSLSCCIGLKIVEDGDVKGLIV